MRLKYGCNPHQAYSVAEALESGKMPLQLLNGTPSLINFLDALNAWQLVVEARAALGLAAAASFKHVSPAGAAVAVGLPGDLARAYEVGGRKLTAPALAYIRARGADPKSSFGDFVALSEPVDEATAEFLKGVISDGIVAPGYESAALKTLSAKKGGAFVVFEADPDFVPPERETREVFGVKLVQDRNNRAITLADLDNVVCGELSEAARRDLVLGLITLKYTQSNSVGYALDGQMIGIGAGQQSRVDCTKLAGAKADSWHLGRHPKVLGLRFRKGVKRQDRINWRVRFIEGDLTADEARDLGERLEEPLQLLGAEDRRAWVSRLEGVCLVSDGFIPFRDNIDHAARHGVRYIAQPGGSNRDAEIEAACREHGMSLVHTGVRLFHH
ncbi:MAG: phosphoribosylaminoimidazolecarboxamide formyltransferase [Deltaproteobacteria bacterium]|nr:phosphoribosylaminoimidazolecarboxamide formyltransferase [Deltaproteobacteria bacterium]